MTQETNNAFKSQINMFKKWCNKSNKMKKLTAMEELIELLQIRDAYKEPMPYIIDVIKEVFMHKERVMIADCQSDAISGAEFQDGYFDCEQYYKETYGKTIK